MNNHMDINGYIVKKKAITTLQMSTLCREGTEKPVKHLPPCLLILVPTEPPFFLNTLMSTAECWSSCAGNFETRGAVVILTNSVHLKT